MEDVCEGAAIGPLYSVDDVSGIGGDQNWIPTQRLEVVQKNKVRGVDSATPMGSKGQPRPRRKLEFPSTDAALACLDRSTFPPSLVRSSIC